MPPLPGNTSTDAAPRVQLLVNVNTPHPTENPRVMAQNRDPHDCSHTEVISPRVGTQNADTTCSQTPTEAENSSPGDGHTGRRTASMWETHPVDKTHKHARNTSDAHTDHKT